MPFWPLPGGMFPVRVLLNPFNHLPDAVDTTQVFHDFWYFWGDVRQRSRISTIGNSSRESRFPPIGSRNATALSGVRLRRSVEFNVQTDEKLFDMNAGAVKQSAASPGWSRPFSVKQATALAPGNRPLRRVVECDHRQRGRRDRHSRGADFGRVYPGCDEGGAQSAIPACRSAPCCRPRIPGLIQAACGRRWLSACPYTSST